MKEMILWSIIFIFKWLPQSKSLTHLYNKFWQWQGVRSDNLICSDAQTVPGPGGDNGGMAEGKESSMNSKTLLVSAWNSLPAPIFLEFIPDVIVLDELLLSTDFKKSSFVLLSWEALAIKELKAPDSLKLWMITWKQQISFWICFNILQDNYEENSKQVNIPWEHICESKHLSSKVSNWVSYQSTQCVLDT